MICRIDHLKDKEIICVKDGTRIGFVCDVEIDCDSSSINALVVYGKSKLFGILGREDDFIIPWENIVIIGEDTILVNFKPNYKVKRQNNFLMNLFELK